MNKQYLAITLIVIGLILGGFSFYNAREAGSFSDSDVKIRVRKNIFTGEMTDREKKRVIFKSLMSVGIILIVAGGVVIALPSKRRRKKR